MTSPRIDATLEREVHRLGVAQTGCNGAFSLRPELWRGRIHRIASGLKLREGESPRLVRLQAPSLPVFLADSGNIRAGYPGPGLIVHESRYGAGCFSLPVKRSGNHETCHKGRESNFRHA